MWIGVPRETAPLERRAAVTPESVQKLIASGFEVVVEAGLGLAAGYADEAYQAAGAQVTPDTARVLSAPIVLKVRPPTSEEVGALQPDALLIALLQPERRPELLEELRTRGVTALALERIPRVTRAQKMDVLSSMANLAGYRAVLEAAAQFQGCFGPQITAAGSSPPAKVLVIGAGVAGLAAISAARALGAEVRAFDTRAAAREQVESLGAKFLEVALEESGDGGGGYAKLMSPEFIAAEMALFRQQAREVDVIITTALVPGAKAPLLVPVDVVECLAPGSIIVDLAAEQGGNCALTVADAVVTHGGVKILGFTDLVSRMAAVASRLFGNNLVHLLAELHGAAGLVIDLESEVIRPALLTHRGEVLPPPPRREPSPPSKRVAPPPPTARSPQQEITSPTRRAWGTTLGGMLVLAIIFFLGRFAPQELLQHLTVFVLACFVGWQVIWSVSPSLHTPLMSVTNAISGIIVVGGILQVGPELDLAGVLGAVAVLIATINVAGGFLVTQRMLKMFHREAK